jgi:hypothetical protein
MEDSELLAAIRRESGGWTGLDVLVELQQALDDMPPTKVQFAPRSQLPEEVVPYLYPEDLLLVLGSWPTPDRFHTGRRETYVNPYASHARRYADVIGECECGALMVHKHDMPSEHLAASHHSEDCGTGNRTEAREALDVARVDWVERAAWYWLTEPQTARRLGLSDNAVRPLCYRLGLSWDGLRRDGRDHIHQVWGELRDEYTSSYIASAFDVSPSSVRTATT